MKRITIFTPTYNRKELLKRLYNSLLNQTNKNFIWLVVDDGSTDDTKELFSKIELEGKIDVKYYYKENGGKHTAHNLAVSKCKTDYFLILDSDDYLADNAIEILEKKIEIISKLDNISGIIGNRFYVSGDVVGKVIPNLEFSKGIDLYEKYHFTGDTLRLYKTEILRKYLFPVIPNERFMPENIVFDKIDNDYKLMLVREKIYFCEYQEEGYSKNINSYHKKSPIGYALSLESSSRYSSNLLSKLKWMILYQIWCNSLKCINAKKNTSNKFIYYLALPFSIIFSRFKFPKFMFEQIE